MGVNLTSTDVFQCERPSRGEGGQNLGRQRNQQQRQGGEIWDSADDAQRLGHAGMDGWKDES